MSYQEKIYTERMEGRVEERIRFEKKLRKMGASRK